MRFSLGSNPRNGRECITSIELLEPILIAGHETFIHR
jgi:hypothetical protein